MQYCGQDFAVGFILVLLKHQRMQNVYLLLRSNKQTGPYSLEELLQLGLKPFDLVWVEGRSAAWQYPSEVPALKPYVPETPQATIPFQPIPTAAMEETIAPLIEPVQPKMEIPKKVFVSVPKSYPPTWVQPPIQKKEELKQEVPSYQEPQPTAQKAAEDEKPKINYSRSLNEVEEDFTNWTYQQKTKKKSPVNSRDAVFAVLILAIVVGGFYVMSEPSVTNAVMPANDLNKRNAQPQVASNNANQVSNEKPTEEIPQQQSLPPFEEHQKNTNINEPVSASKQEQKPLSVPVNQPTSHEKTNPVSNNNRNEETVLSTKRSEVIQQPRDETTQSKKKLGEVIKSIFTKKDKKEEPQNDDVVMEDPKPADNRQAQKRNGSDVKENKEFREPSDDDADDNSALLASQIEITSNAGDNWMLGVRNLKITIRNRSNVTIQAASVQVNYYDENNRLLEKKLVYFSNVMPKGKATAAAPDNKFADHVDFKLVTVSVKEDRYASHK